MSKKRVLIVDDNADLTSLVKAGLERSGNYEVREENDGRAGVSAAREFKPDVILLDYSMPYIQGSDLAAMIHEDEYLKSIPIIFMTGMISKEEAFAHGHMIGGYPFLAKPVRAVEVMDFIEKHLKA